VLKTSAETFPTEVEALLQRPLLTALEAVDFTRRKASTVKPHLSETTRYPLADAILCNIVACE
jgi:hypothetical protein